MRPSAYALPLYRIALWGFLLNAFWEFGQYVLFYDMRDWGFWRGAACGDVGIVLGVVALARLAVGDNALISMSGRGWTALLAVGLLAVGFVASVLLEWLAKVVHLWSYSALMPTITLFGHSVGLSPIAQITALPTLSIALATRSPQ